MAFPYEIPLFNAVAGLLEKLTHTEAMAARMIEQYKGKAKMEGLPRTFAEQAQTVEDALWQVYTERWLDGAAGAQLDNIGKIVNLARQGFTEDEYRQQLRAQILLLRSSGTVEQLYAIVKLLASSAALKFQAAFPAGFYLQQSGVALTSQVASVIAGFVRRGRMAGVRGIFIWQESADSAVFKWDTAGQGWDQGKWAGATV